MLKQSVSGLFRLKSQEKKKKNDVSLHNVRCVSRNPPPRFVGKNHPTTKQVRHRKRDREILSLAWPAVLGASIDPVLSLLDTYWVSRPDEAPLNAGLGIYRWMERRVCGQGREV